ncbi:tautomerase family protein [Suicoccus acidiformans]|uniref:Tautomerase family protein n=1 Tax=Suicoccus acidiformans TaxID=2036206 RepID=A0A347WIY2_9LACT|nr:tautomerase family protein [Suicoccus acidiformans]AXY25039.1 tautomerase family protein [Suicoccus acidiformans]
MPLLKFDIVEGRTEAEITAILDAAHEAVLEALEVPERDRYQIVTQHKPYEMQILDTGLGIERSKDIVVITVFSNKRTYDKKEALYKLLVKKLESKVGISPTDVMISIFENSDEDWSFANGVAQFMTGDL